MNFSAGLRLFTNLVLKNLGSAFIDTNIQHYKFQQPGCYDFSAVILYNTHTGKPLLRISSVGMEIMFSD